MVYRGDSSIRIDIFNTSVLPNSLIQRAKHHLNSLSSLFISSSLNDFLKMKSLQVKLLIFGSWVLCLYNNILITNFFSLTSKSLWDKFVVAITPSLPVVIRSSIKYLFPGTGRKPHQIQTSYFVPILLFTLLCMEDFV